MRYWQQPQLWGKWETRSVFQEGWETRSLSFPPRVFSTAFGRRDFRGFSNHSAPGASGVTSYREHLGMLDDPGYSKRWQRKLTKYLEAGIKSHQDGGGPAGTLIITGDTVGASTPQRSPS
jgi:hypothetical protein